VRFPESWSSTSLAKRTVQKHRQDIFALDRAFALIEGHPRSLWESAKRNRKAGPPAQKLAVYRQYKRLICGMSLEMQGENRKFEFVAKGSRIKGIVNPKGEITVTDKEPAGVNCPK
jgi:hypothetical protein